MMNRLRPILISVLLLVSVFGCGEEEKLPLEVISETSKIPVPEGSAAVAIGEMVLIPAGEFMMGDHQDEGWGQERPVHPVYLDAFYIDKYEVTNAQYAQFLNEYGKNTDAFPGGTGHTLLNIGGSYCRIVKDGNTYKPKAGYENHPVIEVSWYGAAAYAQFRGKRLPTEAEWERAARGSFVGEGKYKNYVWGDEWPPPEGAGNFDKDIAGYNDAYDQTAPVGSFDPNGYGLHDMAGNVCEWCADAYRSSYYKTSEKNNPKGPGVPITFRNNDFTGVQTFRVSRGGSWASYDWHNIRVARRYGHDPTYSSGIFGFRCAGL